MDKEHIIYLFRKDSTVALRHAELALETLKAGRYEMSQEYLDKTIKALTDVLEDTREERS